jgi:hypothetical protein
VATGNFIMRNFLNYYSSDIRMMKSRGMRWSGSGTGEKRTVYQIVVGKPEEKRSLGRPRHR